MGKGNGEGVFRAAKDQTQTAARNAQTRGGVAQHADTAVQGAGSVARPTDPSRGLVPGERTLIADAPWFVESGLQMSLSKSLRKSKSERESERPKVLC